MNYIQPFLKELCEVSGLSGYETPASDTIQKKWIPLVDEIQKSNIGSLHGIKKGSMDNRDHSVLIAAHMDAIGLMITNEENGFLSFTSIGGIDPRVLPGQPVEVHPNRSGSGSEDAIPGLIVQPSNHLLPRDLESKVVPIDKLFIDTGLSPKQVKERIREGDLVSFAQKPRSLSGDTLAAHSLDNRAAVAALTVCLEELQTKNHRWDVWPVATVQEEVGLIGAYTSTFQIRPSLAVVVDTTWAKGPGSDDWNTYPLGEGPTLLFGPNIHPKLHQTFKELAERLEIPTKVEITGRHSGTDAFATQIVAEGIPTMAVGIPIRYMHTPVEVTAIKDINRTGRLLAEFIRNLDEDFLKSIELD
ncbi:M42 family metallopeptidase [Chloroflexota bacterium]